MMRKFVKAFLIIFLLLLAGKSGGEVFSKPSHMDSSKQPRGCAACHGGRGSEGTPLLITDMERFCYECHGSSNRNWAETDIEAVFAKESVHPILDTGYLHQSGEALPEELSSVPRHVSCYDCHVVHLSVQERPWKGAKGYVPGAIRDILFQGPPPGVKGFATLEYELCYLCHSDSANLPDILKNISAYFDPQNPSFHPVEEAGRNHNVPSLVSAFSFSDRISCGDCHGNSDVSGPKGPHGSDYKPLLVAEYRTEDGPENAKAYELCYMCHEQQSILSDVSFKKHYLHVVAAETSCYTCHASHGSRMNKHLISFNELVVTASTNSGGPTYLPSTSGSPKCFLSCHGVEHNSTNVGEKKWPW